MNSPPFPADILDLLNDHAPGTGAPVTPSAEVAEQRAQVMTIEQVEALRVEHNRELAGRAEQEPQKPLSQTDLDILYPGLFR